MTALENRLDILSKLVKKEVSTLPEHLWDTKEKSSDIVKDVFSTILSWSKKDIVSKISEETFFNAGLAPILEKFFNNNVYEAIDSAYPNNFKEWELRLVPVEKWNTSKACLATKWLIEHRLKWSEDDVREKMCARVFARHGLEDMLNSVFDGEFHIAVMEAYVGEYEMWEFSKLPAELWTPEMRAKAVRWLLKERLGLSDKDIRWMYCSNFLRRRNFAVIVETLDPGESTYDVLSNAFPDRFSPSDMEQQQYRRAFTSEWLKHNKPFMKHTQNNKFMWTTKFAMQATRWLVEDKLNLALDEIPDGINKKAFVTTGLSGMLSAMFGGSVFKAIDAAYPAQFFPWEFRGGMNGSWDLETGIEATRWLVEVKLKIPKEDAKTKITQTTFRKYRLGPMLAQVFDGEIDRALEATYPNKEKVNS